MNKTILAISIIVFLLSCKAVAVEQQKRELTKPLASKEKSQSEMLDDINTNTMTMAQVAESNKIATNRGDTKEHYIAFGFDLKKTEKIKKINYSGIRSLFKKTWRLKKSRDIELTGDLWNDGKKWREGVTEINIEWKKTLDTFYIGTVTMEEYSFDSNYDLIKRTIYETFLEKLDLTEENINKVYISQVTDQNFGFDEK